MHYWILLCLLYFNVFQNPFPPHSFFFQAVTLKVIPMLPKQRNFIYQYPSFFFIRNRTTSHNSVWHSNLCKFILHKWGKSENRVNKFTCHQNRCGWSMRPDFYRKLNVASKRSRNKRCTTFYFKVKTNHSSNFMPNNSVKGTCSKPVYRQSLNSPSSLTNFRFVLFSYSFQHYNFAPSTYFIADQNFYF